MTIPAALLDTEALGRLGEQLGDPAIVDRFIRGYVAMLGQRLERLHRAVIAQDCAAWMDVLLSLKTSSTMAGAAGLAALAGELQDEFVRLAPASPNWPCLERAEAVMESLQRVAAETAHQLMLVVDQAAARDC